MTIEYEYGGHDLPKASDFFVGWPNRPSQALFEQLMRGSAVVVTAIDRDQKKVVGFATCITDGVLAAYIPFLEVSPKYHGLGIGTALVRRVLDKVGPIYMTDLVCDRALEPFYERLGFTPNLAMSIRQYEMQSGRVNDHSAPL
ncbi:MAG: GNAT family N-acetyltransferase [Rhizomicrobium sp.]